MKTRLKPKFIINDKGKKTSVIVDIKEYENLLEYLEDIEDANDLLKAEREATGFILYENFRKNLIKGTRS